jgi:hypothetical protein
MSRTACLPALLALASGCTWLSGDTRVLVTSTPPGAAILIDGTDTGLTTPTMVDLGSGGIIPGSREILVRKNGHDDEVRTVYYYRRAYSGRWIDGAADVSLWPWPFFWPIGDVVMPLGVRWVYVPHEVHVTLYKEGTGPVQADEAND